ncbi:MAG: hypothetical protein FJ399_19340 [Verrucomicrobia bacterium]|nr:hypothetical protein [Verrucomicrobiota bacterium]
MSVIKVETGPVATLLFQATPARRWLVGTGAGGTTQIGVGNVTGFPEATQTVVPLGRVSWRNT